MLIFDQLKKNDPPMRALAVVILLGLVILAAGLWWVQIVSSRDYQAHLEMQSFRTVRMPAVRGKILDRNGAVLAENRATYNVSLYLEELRKSFETEANQELGRLRKDLKLRAEAEEKRIHRKLKKEEKRPFQIGSKERAAVLQNARYFVASNVAAQVSQLLRLSPAIGLNPTNFERHYQESRALPFPILTNVTPAQIALFEEQCTAPMGVDLEIQSTRVYPHTNIACHVLGSLKRHDESLEGEEAFVSYRLPDFRGELGIEVACDKDLSGRAGIKSVVVNNLGYRQAENIWQPAEPGRNVVLTIDFDVQRKGERALQTYGPNTRGAFVVLDVQTGDILAMASSPTINPSDSLQSFSEAEWNRRQDTMLKPERNRATQERYAPGSIFKTIIGLACLENGLDPNEIIDNPGFYQPHGARPIRDLAAPGKYNFKEALKRSSNTYFIAVGLRTGMDNIIHLVQHLHLDERTGLNTRQENSGIFPNSRKVHSNWFEGDTANICIGQGQMAVTPLQMAVVMAALANGGKVLWPRLLDRIEPANPATGESTVVFAKGRIRDELGVRPENLKIVREAMLAETEEAGGTGRLVAVPGLPICGKTGTAQVMDQHNKPQADTTWFASFAPDQNSRYAVVVMVETEVNAGTGGKICAPIAHQIYRALLEREKAPGRASTAKSN